MAFRTVALAAACLFSQASGEALQVTGDTWKDEVDKPVADGKMVFVKFYAPWCGHCKKLKPDWDKLAEKFSGSKSNAIIADVDCTDKKNEELCGKMGVQGYPTLKYFKAGFESGESYEDGREYDALRKFVKRTSKKPCDPSSLENCDKKDKAYIEEVKDVAKDKLKESMEEMDKSISEAEKEHKEASELFEKQKEEALATMKKAEDLKKTLSSIKDKSAYKLSILKQLVGEKKDEL